MKTAVFDYTHSEEVDSSLADVVYYNDENHSMAIQFKSNGYSTPSVFYGGVPFSVYESLVNAPSLGKAYNSQIKDQWPNLSGGTIYNVTYNDVAPEPEEVEEKKVDQSDTYSYKVNGYIRIEMDIEAVNRQAAIGTFFDTLVNEGYDEEMLTVTEVKNLG